MSIRVANRKNAILAGVDFLGSILRKESQTPEALLFSKSWSTTLFMLDIDTACLYECLLEVRLYP